MNSNDIFCNNEILEKVYLKINNKSYSVIYGDYYLNLDNKNTNNDNKNIINK